MVYAKKSLGQNYLTNTKIINTMIESLEIIQGDLIVEIGPGRGALTIPLVDKATSRGASVIAVEIDPTLFKSLRDRFNQKTNTTIFNSNILRWLPEFNPKENFKILGAIPYYITSPIIHEIVRKEDKIKKAVLIVQKEVAQKISAKAPEASYLSTFINTFYETEILQVVDRGNFNPSPNVDSAVLIMRLIENPKVSYLRIREYEGFLHHAFSQPRKMLNKAYKQEVLEENNIDPTMRPQHIEIEQWCNFFNSR